MVVDQDNQDFGMVLVLMEMTEEVIVHIRIGIGTINQKADMMIGHDMMIVTTTTTTVLMTIAMIHMIITT
jgi:hypothetical protein